MFKNYIKDEIEKNSEIKSCLEKINILFHDIGVKKYLCEHSRFSLVVYRPVYELARRGKKYGFVPVWITPITETVIDLFPIVKISRLEEDSKNSDCLLNLELIGKTVFVKGVLNKYSIDINDDTKLNVYDIGQPDWDNYIISFNKPKLL